MLWKGMTSFNLISRNPLDFSRRLHEHSFLAVSLEITVGPYNILSLFISAILVATKTGITYKYLGLRMFAYPWNTDNTTSEDAVNNTDVDSIFIKIGELNQQLIAHTETLLNSEVIPISLLLCSALFFQILSFLLVSRTDLVATTLPLSIAASRLLHWL